jgi:hypothetical protein
MLKRLKTTITKIRCYLAIQSVRADWIESQIQMNRAKFYLGAGFR